MRQATKILIYCVTAGVIIYDLVAYLRVGNVGTVSSVIWGWSKLYPIIPFLTGVLMGHLFWQVDDMNSKR